MVWYGTTSSLTTVQREAFFFPSGEIHGNRSALPRKEEDLEGTPMYRMEEKKKKRRVAGMRKGLRWRQPFLRFIGIINLELGMILSLVLLVGLLPAAIGTALDGNYTMLF